MYRTKVTLLLAIGAAALCSTSFGFIINTPDRCCSPRRAFVPPGTQLAAKPKTATELARLKELQKPDVEGVVGAMGYFAAAVAAVGIIVAEPLSGMTHISLPAPSKPAVVKTVKKTPRTPKVRVAAAKKSDDSAAAKPKVDKKKASKAFKDTSGYDLSLD